MRNIFIGCEFSPKVNWQELIGEPKKPGNWGQEAYNKKLPELRLKQQEGAMQHLIAGSVNRACVLEDGLHDTPTNLGSALTGAQLVHALYTLTDANVFGLDTLDTLRLCGWNAKPEDNIEWLWNSGVDSSVRVINLYSCSGAKAAGLSITEMLHYWVPNLLKNATDVLGSDPVGPAEELAAATYTMAKNMGLF